MIVQTWKKMIYDEMRPNIGAAVTDEYYSRSNEL
jgi:hypothetical protein